MSAMKALWQSHHDTYEENMLDALECVRAGWGDIAQNHISIAIKAANAMGNWGDAPRLRQLAWRVQNWLRAGCASPAGITLPDYPGETFVGLYTTAQHYDEGTGYGFPSPERPANLFSVRARSADGPSYVLTDHGTQGDADAAAKLIGGLTGLPVEPPEGTPIPGS